ncbi:30S ribosomal protein S19 [Candidatus Nanohalococcus occultus]|uniref:Small ribosomal subunit protein uS19 n=1 Tax=Candidatus Nanohalococcus occultus TaxID=2978047 RepID=A0ABY8CHP6_9ARCH|nr:Ribosomal protein S19 [Candidatus Nanohaloarchaeota archaeon SVXNc]
MSDEFTYRGHTLEELREMSHEEFAELLNARGRRKINRGLTEDEKKLLDDLEDSDSVKTHERSMIVLPEMVGKEIGVYNGEDFVPVEIDEEMLGHYLGELAKTRKEVSHSAPGLGATRSSQHVPLK